ncbi:MAG: hypothetical protein SNJ57_07570 [Cyanobacteriota bacterium]
MNSFGQPLLDGVGDRLLKSLSAPLQTWLAAHPIAQWLVMHPLWLLGLVILAIALLVGLFGAMGRLTENLWLRLFRLPLAVFAAILGGGFRLARMLAKSSAQQNNSSSFLSSDGVTNPTQRLDQILARLDEVRREEETLLAELKILVRQADLETSLETGSAKPSSSFNRLAFPDTLLKPGSKAELE